MADWCLSSDTVRDTPDPGMPGGPPLQLAGRGGGVVHRGGGPRTGPRPSGGMKGGGGGGGSPVYTSTKAKHKSKKSESGSSGSSGFDLDAALGNTKTL